MKPPSRFRLIIEDEGRLENVIVVSASALKWFVAVAGILCLLMVIGALIAFLTPARQYLPGYMKESERTATVMQLMRLDSLRMAYETNAAFIDNLRSVLHPSPQDNNALQTASFSGLLSADSVLPSSPEEIRFATLMKEREKYNVSVVAPLAAESMMFNPVNDVSVVSTATHSEKKAEIILTAGSTVAAIADGTVIAVSQSIRDGGTAVIIQHPKGFLSRLSRLGHVLVEPGDIVTGGQIIALSNNGNARKGELITLEMWFNGDQLIPYEYIGTKTPELYYTKAKEKDQTR